MLKFGSVCSGIEAASVAWDPLGWKAAWVAEIEAFPSAVLAHHWPEVPNLGDMTKLPDLVANDNIVAPDVLVGGTPCQAFSVAGRRESLADARGALSLSYVRLADEIDERRRANGLPAAVIVWENVPGVLSTKDNAFGCFLAGLAGEDQPLFPTGGKWSNAGLVLGPSRAVAWRILDAQFFGVAQRRRRVFVVASSREGFDPAQVLFEFDGLRRDSAPRREAGQNAAASARSGAAGSHWDDLTNPHPSLNQSHNTGGIGASNQEVFSQRGAGIVPAVTTFDRQSSGEYGTAPIASTVSARDYKDATDLVLYHDNDNEQAVCATGERTHALTARMGKGSSEDGTGRGVPTIAFSSKDYGADAINEMSPTLRAGGHADSHANAGVPPAVTVPTIAVHGTQDPCVGVEVAFAQGRNNGGENAVLTAQTVAQVPMAVRRLTPIECERLQGFPDDHTLIPTKTKRKIDADELRRLRSLSHDQLADIFGVDPETFTGCTDEDLQRLAADRPRYKALGNSMAVPVMRWIGERIDRAIREAGNDNDR